MSLRSWRCSMLSMIVLMGKRRPEDRGGILADADPIRWPVGREDLPDEVLPRHRPPFARVARLGSVVTHHEVLPRGNIERLGTAGVAAVLADVRLIELLAVDVDVAKATLRAQLQHVARQADQPLDERAACAAADTCGRWRLEDDDLAALRVAEAIDEPVREHPVREARLAAVC